MLVMLSRLLHYFVFSLTDYLYVRLELAGLYKKEVDVTTAVAGGVRFLLLDSPIVATASSSSPTRPYTKALPYFLPFLHSLLFLHV